MNLAHHYIQHLGFEIYYGKSKLFDLSNKEKTVSFTSLSTLIFILYRVMRGNVIQFKNVITLKENPKLFFFFCSVFFRVELVAYGGSQARGLIGAIVASLHYSHSNVGSKLCLQPTPQLTATPDS